jgi:hypothetical protein
VRHERPQVKLNVVEADERRMAEWRRLYPEDVAGEVAFWDEKKVARREKRKLGRERRARKRFLEAELDNPNSMHGIEDTPQNGKTSGALPRRAPRRGAAATSSLGLYFSVV